MWRLKPTVLRAALWAFLAARQARRDLRSGISRPTVRPCPKLPRSASSGVFGMMARLDPTCLERSLVIQAWLSAHGDHRDIVIGLPKENFGEVPAHAWVDGTDRISPVEYLELHRLPPLQGPPPARP